MYTCYDYCIRCCGLVLVSLYWWRKQFRNIFRGKSTFINFWSIMNRNLCTTYICYRQVEELGILENAQPFWATSRMPVSIGHSRECLTFSNLGILENAWMTQNSGKSNITIYSSNERTKGHLIWPDVILWIKSYFIIWYLSSWYSTYICC